MGSTDQRRKRCAVLFPLDQQKTRCRGFRALQAIPPVSLELDCSTLAPAAPSAARRPRKALSVFSSEGQADHQQRPRARTVGLSSTSFAAERKLELLVDDYSVRRAAFQPRQTAGQVFRVVCPSPCRCRYEAGVAFGAQDRHPGAGDIAGDTHLSLPVLPIIPSAETVSLRVTYGRFLV